MISKINDNEIGFFKADLAIYITEYIKEHGVNHWREINKVIDDFIEDWNSGESQFYKDYIARQKVTN